MGLVPAATYGNCKALSSMVDFDRELDTMWSDICFDPQTSGGLLFACSEDEGERLLSELQVAGIRHAAIIGRVKQKERKYIYVK